MVQRHERVCMTLHLITNVTADRPVLRNPFRTDSHMMLSSYRDACEWRKCVGGMERWNLRPRASQQMIRINADMWGNSVSSP